MEWQIKTPNNNLAVLLADVKSFLKINYSTDDILITGLIKTAMMLVENYTNRILLNTVYNLYIDCFECPIILTKHKVQSIISIKYYYNDVLTTLSSDYYYLTVSDNSFQKICFKNIDYINFDYERCQPIIIELNIGFGADNTSIPYEYKVCIMNLVSYFYNNRSDCPAETVDLKNKQFSIIRSVLDYKVIYGS